MGLSQLGPGLAAQEADRGPTLLCHTSFVILGKPLNSRACIMASLKWDHHASSS